VLNCGTNGFVPALLKDSAAHVTVHLRYDLLKQFASR
jgi:hypothetical protein